MFDYCSVIKELDSKGIADARIIFTISTLANFAKKNVDLPGVTIVADTGDSKYTEMHEELDKMISLSYSLLNSLNEENKTSCSINDITQYIQANCSELSPELLAFYIAMNAFTEARKEEVFDERIGDMRNIKVNSCTSHIIDMLCIDGGCSLDASMWDMSTSIIKIIKGNENE